MDPNKNDKPATKTPGSSQPEESKIAPEKPASVNPDAPGQPSEAPSAPPAETASVAQEIPDAASASPEVSPTSSAAPDASAPKGDDFGYTETKSNKLLYIFVFVLVVVLLSLVGLFFYKQFINTTSDQQNLNSEPTVAVSPTTEPATEEEAELNQIEIPDLDQELQDVEKDIEQL